MYKSSTQLIFLMSSFV